MQLRLNPEMADENDAYTMVFSIYGSISLWHTQTHSETV